MQAHRQVLAQGVIQVSNENDELKDLTSAAGRSMTIITITKRSGERYVALLPEQQRARWEDYKKRAIAEGRMIDNGNGSVTLGPTWGKFKEKKP